MSDRQRQTQQDPAMGRHARSAAAPVDAAAAAADALQPAQDGQPAAPQGVPQVQPQVAQDVRSAASAASAAQQGASQAQARPQSQRASRRSASQDAQAQQPSRRPAAQGAQAQQPSRQSSASQPAPKKRKGSGRGKTGAIFSGAVLLCILIGVPTTVGMVAVLAALCCYEMCALLRNDAKLPNEWLGVVGAALYPIMYVWLGVWGCILLTLILTAVVMGWYVAYPRARVTDAAATVFSALYTGMMLTSLVIVRMIDPGIWGGVIAAVVVFAVWANDTMAFVWGSRLGRHRMAPRISPKKSWEGCAAGLVGSVVVWCVMCFVPGVNLAPFSAVVCGLVTGVFAVLGDLAESRIKRAAGKKDSGNLLPGHGGFLDRCDALILGSAASVVCLVMFGIIVM